tara:strand:- start:1684 stop:2400 length:717 start_codon:yes stop_codon:yes gene_type:complete
MRFGPKPPTSIITDGLIFYVDAANPESYVSGSTTTNSLVGNITGSLINDTDFSPENQGTWVFDGVRDYIIFNAEDTLLPLNGKMTVAGWFKSTGSNTSQTILTVRPAGGALRWDFKKSTSNTLNFIIRETAASPFYKSIDSDSTLTINDWYYGCVTWDGSNLKLYLNGISDATPIACTSFYYNVATNYTTIGAGWVSNIYNLVNSFNGNIPSTQYYNRALSPEEVQQNYNALKGRFGL